MATITISEFILIFLTCLVSIIFLNKIFMKKFVKLTINLPPSPPSLPIIGHLHLLSPYVYKSLHKISFKSGPFLSLRVGSHPFLLVSSASVAAEFLKIQDIRFATQPAPAFEDSVLFGSSGFVTAPYGDCWRFMKKLCVTELLSPHQLERSRVIRQEEQERFFRRILDKSCNKEQVELLGEVMKMTNNSICRMVMRTRCSEEDVEAEKIRELVKDFPTLVAKMAIVSVLGWFRKLGLVIFGKQIAETSKKYDELFEKILKEHEEKAKREGSEGDDKDLMDILLQVHQDDKAGFKITRSHIKSFFVDIFLAGTDTSSQAAQWAMAELINHPNEFEKVRQEIESVIGRTRIVREPDLQNLPYLRAVVNESLRLHPPVPALTRLCRETCKIKGFDVPANMVAFINVYAIMRDPDSWENPHDFIPERFLAATQDHKEGLDPNEKETEQSCKFLPFGAGGRGCIGSNLGLVFASTAVATMVQCFDWKICRNGKDDDKVSMQEGKGMSSVMARPLKATPIVRFNSY